MKTALALSVILLAGCATAPNPPEDVTVSAKVQAACDLEGGCTLYTKAAMMQRIEDAFAAGFVAGSDEARKPKPRGSL